MPYSSLPFIVVAPDRFEMRSNTIVYSPLPENVANLRSSEYNWLVKIKRRSFLAGVILAASVSISCVGTSENANATNSVGEANAASNANKANDNADELAMIIRLPAEPEDAVWRDEPAGAGSGLAARKLTAVLLFSPANADKIVSAASAHGAKQDTKIEVASWYPTELISQSELAVEPDLPGEAFSGADFVQEPFTIGKLTRVSGTDYFILELQ
jgi:hypothetical protein